LKIPPQESEAPRRSKLTVNSPRSTSESPQLHQQNTMNLPADTGLKMAAF
jgi:hypothetical protein